MWSTLPKLFLLSTLQTSSHHIKTTGPPITSCVRRLDGEKLAAAKSEFEQLERDGIVRRSDSPLVFTPSYGGEGRQQLATVRQFLAAQSGYRAGFILAAEHA